LSPASNGWQPIVKLRRARIAVIGLGGTGGTAALALAASSVGELHCVDGDKVELSNLNRQVLFTEADVGLPKASVAAQRLELLNSDIKITAAESLLDSEAGVRAVAENCDVLVLCADRPRAIVAWVNRACLAVGTPWIHAGYHGPVVTTGTYVPGRGPCRECSRMSQRDRDRERGVYRVDGADFDDENALDDPAPAQ
jgi:molybdopterin/thiamine biosynthesis adenylyltransferase